MCSKILSYNRVMKTKQLTFLLALTFLFFSSTVSFADDLQDAAKAVRNKEYEKAYKLLLPLRQMAETMSKCALHSSRVGHLSTALIVQ